MDLLRTSITKKSEGGVDDQIHCRPEEKPTHLGEFTLILFWSLKLVNCDRMINYLA